MTTQTVWKATTTSGETCHFGVASAARAWAGRNGTVKEITLHAPPNAERLEVLERESIELFDRERLQHAAELACGLLWMAGDRSDKTKGAYEALRDALGGPGSDGLKRSIKAAIDAGFEADHPPGADWWAGKKEAGE